jgi:hypothetical protein
MYSSRDNVAKHQNIVADVKARAEVIIAEAKSRSADGSIRAVLCEAQQPMAVTLTRHHKSSPQI